MSEEKAEAIQHLSAIKLALVDKDVFFPYNYNALLVWGVIGMLMALFMGILLKISVLYGTVFSFVMMTSGFIIEGFLTKEVNKNYDIESCTQKQKFIATLFTIITFFAISLAALLAKYELIVPAYIIWIFLCGVGYFAIGFVLNIKIFVSFAKLKMVVAFLLMSVSYFVANLGDIGSVYFYFVQGVTFVLLGIVPIYIGQKLKKEL